MNTGKIFTALLFVTLFCTQSFADCPDEILEKVDAVGEIDTKEHYCTTVRVSGLSPYEKLALLVPKNPDEKALFYIISSVGIRTLATLPFQSYKEEDYVKILLREIFANNNGSEPQCTIPKNALQLAVDTKMGQSTWVLNVLRPVQCRFQNTTADNTTSEIWNVDFYGGSARYSLDGRWKTDQLKYRRELRQSFTKFIGGRSDTLFASQVARPFFPRCKEKNKLQTSIEPSAVFNSNNFQSPRNVKRQALILNARGEFPYYALKTAEQNRPHSIVLERRIGANKAEPIGAWSISSLDELKNLIFENAYDTEVRVNIKDLDCGQDFVSNWTYIGK